MKILTAYFSRRGLNYAAGGIVDLPVGNTEAAAKMIAELTGCDLYEIERAEPYSKEYRGCVDETKAELAADARTPGADRPCAAGELCGIGRAGRAVPL